MLNIAKIKNGIVIDHIKAGQGLRIFNWLGLGRAPYTVAFVVNASSERMGRKDIIKIDNTISINFDILGFIDPHITVNIIENEEITEKIKLKLPDRVENILICKNPRCVTSTETYVPQVFRLENPELGTYRCEYCDEIRGAGSFAGYASSGGSGFGDFRQEQG
jgi:aspartate carbamoyltransferase regulatory subunit